MARRKTTVETTDKVLATGSDFDLVLPPELIFEPKWTIPVSPNYIAKVYEFEIQAKNNQGSLEWAPDGSAVMKKTYQISVVHKTTGAPHKALGSELYYHRERGDLFETHKLIAYVAEAIRPKKRTRNVRHVEEEEMDY